MNLDRELEAALARQEPDAGFSSRVMHRIQTDRFQRPGRTSWLRGAAALVLISALGAGVNHQLEQRRQRELAHAQLQTALRITSSKLDLARRNVLDQHSVISSPERSYR